MWVAIVRNKIHKKKMKETLVQLFVEHNFKKTKGEELKNELIKPKNYSHPSFLWPTTSVVQPIFYM